MIREECKKQVSEFLKEYPNPRILSASTMIDGFVTCIKPIPTICGAELMCSDNTEPHLRQLIKGFCNE